MFLKYATKLISTQLAQDLRYFQKLWFRNPYTDSFKRTDNIFISKWGSMLLSSRLFKVVFFSLAGAESWSLSLLKKIANVNHKTN